MPSFKNVSVYGDLDFPLLGRTVKYGEVIELTPDQAVSVKGQDDTWEKVTAPAKKKKAAKSLPKAQQPVVSTAEPHDGPIEPPTENEGATS